MSAQIEERVLPLEWDAKPCETTLCECSNPATWAVWVNHHVLGCGVTGFRCDIHFNLLVQEAQRMLGRMRAGVWITCAGCGELLTSQQLSDYVRGIRL